MQLQAQRQEGHLAGPAAEREHVDLQRRCQVGEYSDERVVPNFVRLLGVVELSVFAQFAPGVLALLPISVLCGHPGGLSAESVWG